MPLEFVGILDALIREPVGQQQTLANLRPIQVLRNLLASPQPASTQVGRAAGFDRFDLSDGIFDRLGGRVGRGDHQVDLVVVEHDRETIRGP